MRAFMTALYTETLWREKLITTFTEKTFYGFARLHYHYCSLGFQEELVISKH